jgi:hypothetical protein
MLSIPQIWNLERNISEFGPESILIIISFGLEDTEKEKMACRLYILVPSRLAKCLAPIS